MVYTVIHTADWMWSTFSGIVELKAKHDFEICFRHKHQQLHDYGQLIFYTLRGGEKKRKKRVKQLNRVVWTVRFAPMEEHP